MNEGKINRISGNAILALSLFAMMLVIGAAILVFMGKFNPIPGGDEGAAARLFQLTILLLIPTGFTFLVTVDWQRPKEALKRLMVSVAALVIAFSILYYMEYLR